MFKGFLWIVLLLDRTDLVSVVFAKARRASVTILMAASWLLFGLGATAEGVSCVVSNVRALQRLGTHIVDITYDVVNPDGAMLNVSVAVSDNGGSSYDLSSTHFSGNGFGSAVIPGNNRVIAWDAGADWNNQSSSDICFQLTVDDGSAPSLPDNAPLIPAGAFVMGDTLGDASIYELPIHTVEVSAIYMDACEVTNEQMCEALQWALDQVSPLVVAASGSVCNLEGDTRLLLDLSSTSGSQISYSAGVFSVDSGKEAYPCVEVTWFGAAAFCNYRSLMEGRTPCYSFEDWSCDWKAGGYRLPTEAEWEKASRGGLENQRFPRGMTLSHAQANYTGYSVDFAYDQSDGIHPDYCTEEKPNTSPVASFPANGYGLYDMAGNVYEWCTDWYADDYYSDTPAADPRGADSGVSRSERGGFWGSSAQFCRSAYRNSNPPDFCNSSIGFRSVLAPAAILPVRITAPAIFVDTRPDSDGDGISDLAELGRDGNTANYTAGVDTDPNKSDTDGDGLSDGAEALAATDPLDSDDVFKVLGIDSSEGLNMQVDWSAKSGKTYRVMSSTELDGNWTEAWSGATAEEQAQQTAVSNSIMHYYDTSASGALNRFYRLQLIP